MSYYVTEYTIHFDDTMAYGSHHFLTAFKFQCAARESFLFGEQIFDLPGVKEALDQIHLFTADAYSRNLNPAKLGDRVAILLTLEEWGRASARFCYRVLGSDGQSICAGFQTLLCADAITGNPVPIPQPLWDAMEQLRAIEEPRTDDSFRDCVLAGGSKTESLFNFAEREVASRFLSERYPSPQVISSGLAGTREDAIEDGKMGKRPMNDSSESEPQEVWVFSGQGSFDPQLLSERISTYTQLKNSAREELNRCAAVAEQFLTGDASALLAGSKGQCAKAVKESPELSQVAIFMQNSLGALIRQTQGHQPAIFLGHSFGEIAALALGGCFDLETGVRIVCERVQAVAKFAPPSGGLLAVATDRSSLKTEIALLGFDQVVIAGRNHEQQTIASGPSDQLKKLQEYFRSIDVDAVLVPTPTSFHHPRLRRAASEWLKKLRTLPLSGPKLPVYSPIGRRFISPEDDIASTLASQFLRPFDFQGGLADVIEAGATRFIDCGSSGSLARILSRAGTQGLEVSGLDLQDVKNSESPTSLRNGTTRSAVDKAEPKTRFITKHQQNQTRTNQEAKKRSNQGTAARVAIVGQGCILPAGASSPERLFSAIHEQRLGIIDQRNYDPHWSEDFYSEKLTPDRSTSHLTGRVAEEDILIPQGIEPSVFHSFTRTQKLLCIALAPCIASLEGANRIMCLMGATADGFEDQDVVASLRATGLDPMDQLIDDRIQTARSAYQEPHDAIQEVLDRIVRPGIEVLLVDAACASSLYAVALGMQSLESKDTDAVIAGGVFCPGPGNSCLFSQFHGTTATGCRPFDANADGVVFSEGSALVAMRRLEDAERWDLPISAIVRGVGLSSDGRSSSANVPQTHGQILSLERCYANYDIDPASIHAIEGHGTSTPVGDSTELETLRQFFANHAKNPIPLHSLKGLIGHAGWAAGTASIIAVCEYLRRGIFPAQAYHRESSNALIKSSDTLKVCPEPVSLSERDCRIAIDGFGFGGSNAHVVLESYLPEERKENNSSNFVEEKTTSDEEIVFVACSEVIPTISTPQGIRFDRSSIKVPEDHVLLPDLAEDMDISQTLAIALVDKIVDQIPQINNDLRQETGIVLAQSGKTERGVEATMRVLASRFRRQLQGLDLPLEKLNAAYNRVRPSGPYTLQCMMPNVSAGRAALQFNLNGPNFVVDSGTNSLESALTAASLLLQGGSQNGTKLVILATIDANPWKVPRQNSAPIQDEFAAAFALTTRSYAEASGMKIVSPVSKSIPFRGDGITARQEAQPTGMKVHALIKALETAKNGNAKTKVPHTPNAKSSKALVTESKFPVHVPVWIEAPLTEECADVESLRQKNVLAIVRAEHSRILELGQMLSSHAKHHRIMVVGPSSKNTTVNLEHPTVSYADLDDEVATNKLLADIDGFKPDVILGIEMIASWELSVTLNHLSDDNSLCELLFLIAQRNVDKLEHGTIELNALFFDAWNGTVHPSSGAIAGTLKAIKREFPAARIGVTCTRDLSLGESLDCLVKERMQKHSEPEVVYDGATRLVRRLRKPFLETEYNPQVALDKNSVVIATGGARGVTAILIEALLRDYGCTVVALGRSPLEQGPDAGSEAELEREYYARFMHENPTATAAEMKRSFEQARARWEANQTIENLNSVGSRVEYRVADVTNPNEVKSVVQEIASKYGRVDLIVHGAGVQMSKRLENRSLEDFRKTFSVKISGLRNLFEQCLNQFGKHVNTHVLTSAYSIFGNDGQHDYGAANETLDRLCELSKVASGSRWASIAWLAWDGIGMTRGTEYHALAKHRSLSCLNAKNGQRIFREVFEGNTHSEINVPISEAEHAQYEVKTIPAPINRISKRVIEVSIELSKIEWLTHHKVRNTPTLPGAWILERMVDAALQLREDSAAITSAIVQNATFNRFVRYSEGQDPSIRVVAEETSIGIVVWMIGDILHSSGATLSKDIIFAEATVNFESKNEELHPSLWDIDSLHFSSNQGSLHDPYCNAQHSEVELSGPFDCVRDISIGTKGRRAKFVPCHTQSLTGVIPALLLDSAWRVGAMYADPDKNELYVPVHISRLILPVNKHASTFSRAGCEIRATAPRMDNGIVRWDRTEVVNNTGALKLVVEDAFATRLN